MKFKALLINETTRKLVAKYVEMGDEAYKEFEDRESGDEFIVGIEGQDYKVVALIPDNEEEKEEQSKKTLDEGIFSAMAKAVNVTLSHLVIMDSMCKMFNVSQGEMIKFARNAAYREEHKKPRNADADKFNADFIERCNEVMFGKKGA